MNNFIKSIHCRAKWDIINEFKEELDKLGLQSERGPLCFSTGHLEYISIALPIASAVVGAVAGIIVAFIKRGKKVRIVFDGGRVKEIDASNYDPDEIAAAIQKIKAIDIVE
ncbi:hypothetical protein [Pantoea sp. CFSAN033090]|uniref:hypothetical protein n=1 Tax=Pantoea sp. CFSAN033090 TaxID=1690502 RepID=UPI0006900FA3|nr:hypothetical protein [Pantoea sp. CFSAN033090]KOA72255.1 hypothetical protein AFL22_00430 [Pantoea sp. CFSAN033090]